MTGAICRICGNGHLHFRTRKNRVEYKGAHGELDLNYSVCDGCGTEQANGDQLRSNKRAMIHYKKSVDGLLTGQQVRSIRENLNLSQSDAAKIFGGGPVAFSKYENDDVAQSEAMDKMIRLAAELPAALGYLTAHAGYGRAIIASWWSIVEDLTPKPDLNHRPKLRLIGKKINPEIARYAA